MLYTLNIYNLKLKILKFKKNKKFKKKNNKREFPGNQYAAVWRLV